jgi:hypothetical protein
MIQRRKFLIGGIAVASIAALGTWGFGRSVIESQIAAILRKHLRYLTLDEEGVRSYAKDRTTRILAKRVSMSRMRYHVVSAFGTSYVRFARSSNTESGIERARQAVVSTYLLSSDFFLNGSNEARTVHYLGYYDPMHACGNPFAQPIADNSRAT